MPQPNPAQPSTPGFDPRRALGEPAPQSRSIGEFAPPPNRTPLLIILVALITLVLVIAGGIFMSSQPVAAPSASPTPSASAPTGPGHPFTTQDGRLSGRWEILRQTWTDKGLQLQVRVASDSGAIPFGFLAFSNASTEVYEPTSSPLSPDIQTGTARPSSDVVGYVFFPLSKGDATIILTSGTGRQMSALPVKG